MMPIVYQDTDFIVEQGIFAASFKITSRATNQTVKTDRQLLEAMGSAWHGIRTNRIASPHVTREAENIFFRACAHAAFDHTSIHYAEIVNNPTVIVVAKMIDAAGVFLNGNRPSGATHGPIFSNARFTLTMMPDGRLEIEDRSRNRTYMSSTGRAESALSVIDTLQYMRHWSHVEREQVRLKTLNLFCMSAVNEQFALDALQVEPMALALDLYRGDYDLRLSL